MGTLDPNHAMKDEEMTSASARNDNNKLDAGALFVLKSKGT